MLKKKKKRETLSKFWDTNCSKIDWKSKSVHAYVCIQNIIVGCWFYSSNTWLYTKQYCLPFTTISKFDVTKS